MGVLVYVFVGVFTLFAQREAVLVGNFDEKNAPFDISVTLVEVISERSFRKKVTA